MVQKKRKKTISGRSASHKKRRSRTRRRAFILWVTALLLIPIALVSLGAYLLLSPAGNARENTYIYVRPTTTLTDVERQLQQNTRLRRPSFFHLAARYYKLGEKLRPGRYGIAPQMNTKQILETLAHGKQSAVRFHLRHVRNICLNNSYMAIDMHTDFSFSNNPLRRFMGTDTSISHRSIRMKS